MDSRRQMPTKKVMKMTLDEEVHRPELNGPGQEIGLPGHQVQIVREAEKEASHPRHSCNFIPTCLIQILYV